MTLGIFSVTFTKQLVHFFKFVHISSLLHLEEYLPLTNIQGLSAMLDVSREGTLDQRDILSLHSNKV